MEFTVMLSKEFRSFWQCAGVWDVDEWDVGCDGVGLTVRFFTTTHGYYKNKNLCDKKKYYAKMIFALNVRETVHSITFALFPIRRSVLIFIACTLFFLSLCHWNS